MVLGTARRHLYRARGWQLWFMAKCSIGRGVMIYIDGHLGDAGVIESCGTCQSSGAGTH